jgi:hypothetical protein
MTPWIAVHGILARGDQVASGRSEDYPDGALDCQRPIFAERGFDLSGYFNGTLNVDIRSQKFGVLKPEYTFQHVEWTDLHPPEHFSFSRCKVLYKDVEYDGQVDHPHPETKICNFQNPSLLEVVVKLIPDIQYDDELGVTVTLRKSPSMPNPQRFV